MTKKPINKYDPAECQALGCHNEKRAGHETCSLKCEEIVASELENAPYGDHFAFPCFPLGIYQFAEG